MTVHDTQSPVTPADVTHFWEQGYVRLRGILTPDVVEQLREAMSEALKTFRSSPSSYDITAIADAIWTDTNFAAEGSEQHDIAAFRSAIKDAGFPRLLDKAPEAAKRGRFLVDTSVWRRVSLLADVVLHGVLPQVAATLLQRERIRYYDDQLFIKEPGTQDRAAFHQDLPYFHLDGTQGCVMWIPLDPVRKGTGSIAYVPGSHNWGFFNANLFMSRAAFPGSNGRDLPDIENDPNAYNVQHVEADPGDVIVHHFLTVHGSEGNLGTHDRRAFSLRYCDPEIRYLKRAGAPTQPLHRADMQDGDPLDDSIHPIVWPPSAATHSQTR